MSSATSAGEAPLWAELLLRRAVTRGQERQEPGWGGGIPAAALGCAGPHAAAWLWGARAHGTAAAPGPASFTPGSVPYNLQIAAPRPARHTLHLPSSPLHNPKTPCPAPHSPGSAPCARHLAPCSTCTLDPPSRILDLPSCSLCTLLPPSRTPLLVQHRIPLSVLGPSPGAHPGH